MIDKRLLDILVCPESQTPLGLVDSTLLAKVNQAIAEGRIKNRSGQMITEPLMGALVREDQTLLYPIVDDIPVMLIDEAIPLNQIPY
ncbi:MAG: Trm112 family protein [Pirellulales bacterium]|nr:Trm112 family protein [Pirellulales bacterium]